MEADRKRIKNSDIQVCTAWGRLVRLDGTTQIVNLAGLASGRYAMTKVSVSIGKTKDEDALGFPKTKLLELVPIGYDSTVIELLDVAGYMTFREYDGLDDIFVYHTKMMCKNGSDFRYAEDVRVKNKIIRETARRRCSSKTTTLTLRTFRVSWTRGRSSSACRLTAWWRTRRSAPMRPPWTRAATIPSSKMRP